MADKADLPLVDPREIRKLLQRVARLGGRMDDKAGMAMTGGIVHACMRSAEALGLSGEERRNVTGNTVESAWTGGDQAGAIPPVPQDETRILKRAARESNRALV